VSFHVEQRKNFIQTALSYTLKKAAEKLSVASVTSVLTVVLVSSAREMYSVLSMKHSVTATNGWRNYCKNAGTWLLKS